MEEREYLLILYELYGDLLTDKEKTYFENYYYEDLSLQEIADNFDVSKAYSGKMVQNAIKKLYTYESILRINEKNNNIKKIISNLDDDIKSKIEDLL